MEGRGNLGNGKMSEWFVLSLEKLNEEAPLEGAVPRWMGTFLNGRGVGLVFSVSGMKKCPVQRTQRWPGYSGAKCPKRAFKQN